ncbi:Asp-tRNA(Asn)/Glu-tRNA(Gln) amidotransferase subunit GatA, partial [Patescibacteria group bacterium]|nr:Asp-tRNA(Asn)/Glu-tRNA(Gln) amidotransferase subunit GatA [Patescibacteria group bacterium]
KEYFVEGIDLEVEKIVKKAITQYEKLGAKIIEVSLPHTHHAVPCYYIIVPAEASANLARYDGIKYGLSEQGKDLLNGYLKTRQKGFGDEVRRRIMVGTYVLSAGYYDAYYLKAQKVRTLIKQDFDSAFEKVDVLMTPVSPTPAFKIGEKTDDPVAMYLSDIYTCPVNLAGISGLSLPCGQTIDGQLPVGLQIIGRPFDEEKIFQVAEIYEQLKTN